MQFFKPIWTICIVGAFRICCFQTSLNITLCPFIGRIFSSQDILLVWVILNAEIPETVPFAGITLYLNPPVFAPAHFMWDRYYVYAGRNEINKIKNDRNLKNILQQLQTFWKQNLCTWAIYKAVVRKSCWSDQSWTFLFKNVVSRFFFNYRGLKGVHLCNTFKKSFIFLLQIFNL